MSAIEIKQLKDKIEKLTQELWALENEEPWMNDICKTEGCSKFVSKVNWREGNDPRKYCEDCYLRDHYEEEEEITPCDRCPCSDISWCWSNGCDKGKRRIEWLEEEEEEEKCWTCDVSVATHKTYRDALGEFELTCDKCYREEYPEEYEEEEEEEELTWQEEMKKYDLLVDACRPIAFTKDEDLVVGDIVEHSFGCRDYKLMCVDRLTEKTIWYKECWTKKHRVRDSGGDEHTYGKFLGRELANGLNYKRKRRTKVLDNANDEKWRGQRVYKYPNCGNIWIKEEESDIWR